MSTVHPPTLQQDLLEKELKGNRDEYFLATAEGGERELAERG